MSGGKPGEEAPTPVLELAVQALELLDAPDDVEEGEEYAHIEQPAEQKLKNGMPIGEEVTIVSDDETHHYAVAKWKGLEFRERIPLHTFKLFQENPAKAMQEFNEIARRLRTKLCKKITGAPPDVRTERDRRRRGRKLARQEAEQMYKERVQTLHAKTKAASSYDKVFESPEAFHRAEGMRIAAAHMLGFEPEKVPRPSRFLSDGATLDEILTGLGLKPKEPPPAAAVEPADQVQAPAAISAPPGETVKEAAAAPAKTPKPKAKGKTRAKPKKPAKKPGRKKK